MRTTTSSFPLHRLFLLPLVFSFLLLAATCLVAPSLRAQATSTQPRDWRKIQVREQVEEMRKAMREGRIVRYNVQVKVRLKNGNKISGIVRNGRFIEKHDGLDFVTTDGHSESAGLRLWYYNGTNSYIFLPYTMVAHYQLGLTMSDREVADLERKLVEEERKRRELERQLAEDRVRKLAEEASKKDGKQESPLQEQSEELRKHGRVLTADERGLLKWLEDYPPDKGWGEKKFKDLQVRRITVGVYPNQEEKRFEENFETWKKAAQLKAELDKLKQGQHQQQNQDPQRQDPQRQDPQQQDPQQQDPQQQDHPSGEGSTAGNEGSATPPSN